jgi:hypothetical protein
MNKCLDFDFTRISGSTLTLNELNELSIADWFGIGIATALGLLGKSKRKK